MLGNTRFRTHLPLKENPDPVERRLNLVKEVLSNSTPFPKTVGYKEIDEEFKKWAEEKIKIAFEDRIIPTFALYSNQRFSEYMQMWENSDEDRNSKMNFKIITRENNPKYGTMYGDIHNVPGNNFYLMKRVEALNNSKNRVFIDFKMRQPVPIDIKYQLSIVTNKYELLNIFNKKVNDSFKEIQAYIRPNGHFMTMKLETISDESEYNIDDRQYYSQTCDIIVNGYILTEEDFREDEVPIMNVTCVGDGENSLLSGKAEIEELEVGEEEYEYQPIKLTVSFENCDKSISKFNADEAVILTSIEMTNVRRLDFYINDTIYNRYYPKDEEISGKIENLYISIKSGDAVKIKVKKINVIKKAYVYFTGYYPYDAILLDENTINQKIDTIEINK